jgi:hypothetical protein
MTATGANGRPTRSGPKVTNDLQRAVAVFRDQQGVAEIAVFEDFRLEVPGGREAVINVGLAYVGDVKLEIIEPVSGEVGL